MFTRWVISIRSGQNRRDFEFETRDDETPQETYRRVKANAAKFREKVGPLPTIDIISHTIAFKAKGTRPSKHHYWCPYCNQWRVFIEDDTYNVNRCPICGISDSDFYVRQYNGLWKKVMITGNKKPMSPMRKPRVKVNTKV